MVRLLVLFASTFLLITLILTLSVHIAPDLPRWWSGAEVSPNRDNTTVQALEARLQQLENQLKASPPPASLLHLESGSWRAKRDSPDWRLTDVLTRRRRLTQTVSFQRPFTSPPAIVLGVTLIDPGQEGASIEVSAQEIGTDDFLLVLESWSDNRIREIQLNWLAHGHAQPLANPD
ncbi:MAG: H-type lectin domain-containing protein [Magnetococcales bacterium]|nr:H-type lectin domain-containing protein [Magnetococcales bacterium]